MIYLECYTDKALVMALGIHKKEIYHSGNKGNVCKNLIKNRKSVGLVDEDPFSAQPSYITKLKTHPHQYSIKFLYDENSQNHLIMLCPRLEDWILQAAKESRIKVKEYDLPDDAEELHKIININPGKYLHLIEDIKKKKSKMLKNLELLLKAHKS